MEGGAGHSRTQEKAQTGTAGQQARTHLLGHTSEVEAISRVVTHELRGVASQDLSPRIWHPEGVTPVSEAVDLADPAESQRGLASRVCPKAFAPGLADSRSKDHILELQVGRESTGHRSEGQSES